MTQEFRYHGELIAGGGLESVAKALTDCSWAIELRRSGYAGTLYLRTSQSSTEIDLEMNSGQSVEFVFSGGITATAERANDLLGEFSQLLGDAGCRHRLELHTKDASDKDIAYFHHEWPDTMSS